MYGYCKLNVFVPCLSTQRDIELAKKNWELSHLQSLREEEERLAQEEEFNSIVLTYDRPEAASKVVAKYSLRKSPRGGNPPQNVDNQKSPRGPSQHRAGKHTPGRTKIYTKASVTRSLRSPLNHKNKGSVANRVKQRIRSPNNTASKVTVKQQPLSTSQRGNKLYPHKRNRADVRS